jgi:hypothetical protein
MIPVSHEVSEGSSIFEMEHLLVSKALPILFPRKALPIVLAPHYFCAYSDLSLLCEAYADLAGARLLWRMVAISAFPPK